MRTVCLILTVLSFGGFMLDIVKLDHVEMQLRAAKGLDSIPYALQRQYLSSSASVEFGFGVVFLILTIFLFDYEAKMKRLFPTDKHGNVIDDKKKMCGRCGAMHNLPGALCLDCASREKFSAPETKAATEEKPTPGIKVWGS